MPTRSPPGCARPALQRQSLSSRARTLGRLQPIACSLPDISTAKRFLTPSVLSCTQGKKSEVSAGGAAMLANIMEQDSAPLSQKDLNPILAAHERFAAYQGGKRAQLTRKGLDGLNLANRVLSEADFSGSSFVGATLYGSNLQRASLYCADLRGANLQAANLMRADMRGCSFRGANLSYAIMDGGDMRAARMMIVNQGKMSVMDRRSGGDANANDPQIPDGVDFTNCSMKHVSFGNAKLDNANFSGAIMDGA